MIRRKLIGVKRNEVRKALKHKSHRMFVLNEKRKRRNRKDEAFTNGWDALMGECIDIETAADAKSYFYDVENLAKKLELLCSDGKPFKASDAIKEWYWVAEQVEKSVQDLLDKYGEDADWLPVIGLKYYGHDDTLAIGIYDNGDFTACVGWEFREALTHKLRVDDYDDVRYSRKDLNNV
jgi:hypothetical protein